MSLRAVSWQDRIGRRVKLRDLHILTIVAQAGSMAKAAQQLGISQPSVSEAVADLEHAIGHRLLDRNPQGVQPTIYGAAILQRSLAVFDELRQGIRDVEFLADSSVGELSIASPETLTAGFVPAVISELHHHHPRLVFKVTQANTVTLEFDELRKRKVDLALARLTRPLAEVDFDVEPLFQDRLLVVAGANHPLAARRKLKLTDLAEEHWIAIPPEMSAGSFAAEVFGKAGPPIAPPAIISHSQIMRLQLLATGRYVTTMSESAYRYNARSERLKALPIDLELPPRTVVAVMLKGRTPSPVAAVFIEHARRVAHLHRKQR